MKSPRAFAATLSLALLAAGPLVSAQTGTSSDDPFEKLKSYDFQSRKAVDAIHKLIQADLYDRAKTALIEQHLIAVLDDPATTFAGKQEACQMLWVIGSSRSVPTLSKMLADDEKLSDIARYALERNTDPSAAKALRDALATTHGKTQIGVINSLGNRADAEAPDTLAPFAASSDPAVSEAAITALGKIGTEKSVETLRSLPATSLLVNKALLRSAERMADAGKKGEAQRIDAELAAENHPAVVRAEALRGLAILKSPRTSAVALSALTSPDGYLQNVAAHICGSLGDPKTTTQAINDWPTLPVPAQVVLLTAFADHHDPAALKIAMTAMTSKDPALRTAGIHALGLVGGAQVVPTLVQIATHGEGSDKDVARDGLASLPGSPAEQSILLLARTGPPESRMTLLSVLPDRPTPAAVAILEEAAQGTDTHVAVEAIRGLARVGGATEHTLLIKLLVTTPNDDVRDAAKDAIVAIGQHLDDRDRGAEPVLAALPNASAAGKVALLGVLAEIGGDQALDALTKATASTEPDVKQAAVTALAETWSDSRPLPVLLNIAKSDSSKSLRIQALRGYLRLVGQDDRIPADDRVTRIAAAVNAAERTEEKTQALGILRDCRVPAAVDLSAKLLDTPELFSEAADTVIYLAGPQRKNDRDLPAVKGPGTTAALDKIIQNTKDDDQKARAQKVR